MSRPYEDLTIEELRARALAQRGEREARDAANRPDDGGHAFPRPEGESETSNDGMTLRDWFAGQAMAKLVELSEGDYRSPDAAVQAVGRAAYMYADAMIAEKRQMEGEQ